MQNTVVPQDHAWQLGKPRGLTPAVGVSSPEDSRQRVGRACEVQLQIQCFRLGHNLGNSWPGGLQEKAAVSSQAA